MRLVFIFIIAIIASAGVFAYELNCDTPKYTEYGDKVFWTCELQRNDTEALQPFNCVSYVKDMQGGMVQTNPDYDKKSETLISFGGEYDDREHFKMSNGLVNPYFSDNNLVFDKRNYTYGVECVYEDNTAKYEETVVPEYSNPNRAVTLWFYIDNNFWRIFFVFLLVIILIMVGGTLWRILTR